MSLPKEPRQKMINLMYLVLTALLALNVSSEILNAFKVVDKSLMTSNENLNTANNTLYTSLEAKLKDPMTAELYEKHLKDINISSMLIMPISIDNNLFGVISLSNIGEKRHWSNQDHVFVTAVSNIVSTY